MLDLIVNRVDRQKSLQHLLTYIRSNNVKTYPIQLSPDDIGVEEAKNVIIFMASLCFIFDKFFCYNFVHQAHQMFKNFNSTHCTPLPPSMFGEPFDLFGQANQREE